MHLREGGGEGEGAEGAAGIVRLCLPAILYEIVVLYADSVQKGPAAVLNIHTIHISISLSPSLSLSSSRPLSLSVPHAFSAILCHSENGRKFAAPATTTTRAELQLRVCVCVYVCELTRTIFP